ncbi:MAG: hypothetical protein Kow00117_00770 [Phototrophicales bacterium]
MINRLFFYVQYALRNLYRSRRWSLFAILSVTAGVAAVVALRSMGLAIQESLTTNIQASNHGDITLERGSLTGGLNFGAAVEENVFQDYEITQIQHWAEQNNAQMTQYITTNLQLSEINAQVSRLSFVTAILIDPNTYPPTQDIVALEPSGVPLSDLFTGGYEVVISQNLAATQNLSVGDAVRVTGSTEPFIIRGIVPTSSEAGLRDIFAAYFGFAYFDYSHTATLSVDPRPNRISLLMPANTPLEIIEQAGNELHELLQATGTFTRVLTVASILEQNQAIADILGRFIVVLGLGSLLIGGVGIINTMLVMVRRRTSEIAALKTFGLKGRQIAILFMMEALFIGIAGSILGSITGTLLSRFTNQYGETFIQQSLPFRIYPEAIIFGIVLGIVVTAVFGVIPVLTAVQVRPNIILRPNEPYIPTLGIIHSLGVIMFVVISLGVIAGQIIGPFPDWITTFEFIPLPQNITAGILTVAGTLLLLMILTGMMWLLVWLISRMPAFGWLDLSIALKNLKTGRLRTATTIIAISTGMFAISSISFYTAGVQEILAVTLTESFGGNVLVLTPASFRSGQFPALAQFAEEQFERKLTQLDGIVYRTQILSYSALITAVDGQSTGAKDNTDEREALLDAIRQAGQSNNFGQIRELNQAFEEASRYWINITVRDTENPDFAGPPVNQGVTISQSDYGRPVGLLRLDPRIAELGIGLGSQVTLQVKGISYTIDIVGVVYLDSFNIETNSFGDLLLPPGLITNTPPDIRIDSLLVEEKQISDVILELSTMVGFFPLDVKLIDGIVSRLIDQFTALPLLVGILSLGAAAVIMANTVALATFERRRQIGILKAIGLKANRILRIMVLENLIISLVGAIFGIGTSGVMFGAFSLLGWDELVLIPDDSQTVVIALLIAALMIASLATIFSANIATHERVLNVLRYD